jgi:hypothetical protein
MTTPARDRSQYLLLSEQLKRLPGSTFEAHHHPAVVLDLATGPGTQVWGWWTDEIGGDPARPCLLWAAELGWSATVVEPDMFDSEGYERAFWSHRIKLLDLALANALGPCPSLEDLELQVVSDETLGADSRARELRDSLLWGILELESARTCRSDATFASAAGPGQAYGVRGSVDEELVAGVLSPSFAKPGLDDVEAGRRGLAALMQAVAEVPRGGRRHLWSRPA